MQLNEIPPQGHEHATTSMKVLLLIFAVALIAVLGYFIWYQNAEPDTADNSAPSVINKTGADETNETAGWKTYTDEAGIFSFMYPPTVTVGSTTKDETSIAVKTYDLLTMEDEPLGYDKASLTALRDDLKSGKVKTAITAMYAKETLTLRVLEICDRQFTYTLDVFDGENTMVQLTYALNGEDKITAIANNADYFTTDSTNCGTEKIWKDTGEEGFRTALVDGTTDTVTQTWHKNFGLVTKSFKFVK